MFIVITYPEQKTFYVQIMGYMNLVVYVQYEIDNIFQDVQEWARAYVNDIMCRRRSLADLFPKLRVLFEIFLCYNILI